MLFRLFSIYGSLILKSTIVILSLSFLHAIAWPAQAFAENAKILIYGDSLSAAYGLPKQQGWPYLLQNKLKTEHFNYTVVNASISGETTSGGMSRIGTVLKQTNPDIVILALGANDGLRGLPIKEMFNNLNSMITLCKKIGAKLLLVGMKIPPNYGPKYTKTFSETYHGLSQQHHISLVPFMLENVAAQPHLLQDDGLHPNALGQPIILQNIWPQLQPLLKRQSLPAK